MYGRNRAYEPLFDGKGTPHSLRSVMKFHGSRDSRTEASNDAVSPGVYKYSVLRPERASMNCHLVVLTIFTVAPMRGPLSSPRGKATNTLGLKLKFDAALAPERKSQQRET